MRVSTLTTCPKCTAPAPRLVFDTDSGQYDCGAGHSFAEEPTSAPASETRTETPVIGGLVAPPSTVEPLAAPVVVVPAVDVAPAARAPEVRPAVTDLEALMLSMAPVRCSNGDLLVVVRIAEQHAVTMLAESEVARRQVGDYFQRAVSFGLDNDWFRNAGN